MADFEAELPRAQGTASLISLASDYNSFKNVLCEFIQDICYGGLKWISEADRALDPNHGYAGDEKQTENAVTAWGKEGRTSGYR